MSHLLRIGLDSDDDDVIEVDDSDDDVGVDDSHNIVTSSSSQIWKPMVPSSPARDSGPRNGIIMSSGVDWDWDEHNGRGGDDENEDSQLWSSSQGNLQPPHNISLQPLSLQLRKCCIICIFIHQKLD
jgi:hypothetical protein